MSGSLAFRRSEWEAEEADQNEQVHKRAGKNCRAHGGRSGAYCTQSDDDCVKLPPAPAGLRGMSWAFSLEFLPCWWSNALTAYFLREGFQCDSLDYCYSPR
jgi:hypothetical protein